MNVKKIMAVLCAATCLISLVGCGKSQQKTDSEVVEHEVENNVDNKADASNGATDEGKMVACYNKLIKDLDNFTANEEGLNKEYVARDYMYFDYDKDGDKEVILYLEYCEEEVFYRDVCFMDYDADADDVYVRAISNAEVNDNSFYAEYLGDEEDFKNCMARYSWTTNPYESYTYAVIVDDSFRFVLVNAYDYLASDIEEVGLSALPLHGEWELIFTE